MHFSRLTVLGLAAVTMPVLFLNTSDAVGQIIAQTGFNDQSGINSNPTPNSPYQFGQSVLGMGTGEPGWTSTWSVNAVTNAGPESVTTENAAAKEGDGGLSFTANSGIRALRTYPIQSRTVVIEADINFVAVGDLQSRPGLNSMNEPAKFGPLWLLSGPTNDRRFYVSDGVGNGIVTWEDTGILQKPGEWQHIKVAANVVTQTFTFAVDGVTYASPDPLGFTGQPAGIDEVEYLSNSSGWIDSVVVSVPEPTALGILALAIPAAMRRRRR